MPKLSPEIRSLQATAAAHTSWAKTTDRSARTRNARRGFAKRFDDQVDPGRVLPPEERAKRAEHARKAYFAELAVKSAKKRAARDAGGGA